MDSNSADSMAQPPAVYKPLGPPRPPGPPHPNEPKGLPLGRRCGRISGTMAAQEPQIPTFSFVVPVYNEQEGLEHFYGRLKLVADELREPYEILLVNDGSTDASASVIRRSASSFSAAGLPAGPMTCFWGTFLPATAIRRFSTTGRNSATFLQEH